MKLAKACFDDIRKLIVGARTSVARGVDLVQVHTNFQIGRRIVQEELRGKGRGAYGEEIIKDLAVRLTGGNTGSNPVWDATPILYVF